MSELPVTVSPAAPKRPDFPTWLPPMLVKELRQGLRTRGFVGAFVIFQLVMAVLMIGSVSNAAAGTDAMRAAATSTLNGFFWAILAAQMLLVTPGRALASLQTERDARTLDLLLLTRLSAWRIVVGKWASLLAQAALLLVAMLPYGIVRYFGGSVDLVSDAALCLALLAGCALLTAGGLWASGLPRVVRILVPIAVVFSSQMWTTLFRTTGGTMSFGEPALWCLNGALVTVFFLVTAVRRIAPPAESHVPLARVLPVFALLPVPLWVHWGSRSSATAQMTFAGCFLALVCVVELANMNRPMLAHWQSWARRGVFGRFVGRLALTGWASALLYALLCAALLALTAMYPGLLPAGAAAQFFWQVVLGLGALVFPVIVLSLLERPAAKGPGGLYVLVFGLMSTVAAIAAALSSMFPHKYSGFESFARVLPVSGFWLSLRGNPLPTEVILGQGAFVVIVLGVALAQSRAYWKQLAHLEVRAMNPGT